MQRRLDEAGGKDRPLFQPTYWHDLVLEEHVEQDLRMLIRLLEEPGLAKQMKIEAPTGVLLIGPPGTGKTMIGRLIATATRRSFYPITAADVLGGLAGDSVKRVAQIFSRAKQESPSVILIDEMDGLLPRAAWHMSHHDVQVVEQFLIEIGSLLSEHNVFLVGTTNDPDGVRPARAAGRPILGEDQNQRARSRWSRTPASKVSGWRSARAGVWNQPHCHFHGGFRPCGYRGRMSSGQAVCFDARRRGSELPAAQFQGL